MERATHILGTFATRRLTDEDLFARAIKGEAAADATQEVFVRLLKAAPGSVERPRAWLFTVARNVSTDAIRKRLRDTPRPPMPMPMPMPMPVQARGHAYGRTISHPHAGLHRGRRHAATAAVTHAARRATGSMMNR